MKLFTALGTLLTLGGTLLTKVHGESSTSSIWDGIPNVITSCDDFEGGAFDLEGTISLLRSIECKKHVVFHVYDEAVLRSHDVFGTENVEFFVHTGGVLTITAEMIDIRRAKGSTSPLFLVEGHVEFQARGRSPSHKDVTPNDEGGLIHLFEGGTVSSQQAVSYSTNSIVVADMNKTPKALDDGATKAPRLTPRWKAELEDFQSLTDEDKLNNRMKHNKNKIDNNNKNNKAAGGGGETGEADPARGSTGRSQLPAFVRSLLIDDPGTVDPNRALHVGVPLDRPLLSPDGNSAVWPGVDGTLMFGKTAILPPELAAREGSLWATTTPLLPSNARKARKVLNKRASLVNLRRAAQNTDEGANPQQSSEGVAEENGSGSGVPNEGIDKDIPENKVKVARPSSPWVKRPEAVREQAHAQAIRDSGKDKLQARMSLDHKGCLEVSLDDTCVLRKSGPRSFEFLNRFPFRIRKRSEDYKMVATSTGLEVHLGDKTVWGVTAVESKD